MSDRLRAASEPLECVIVGAGVQGRAHARTVVDVLEVLGYAPFSTPNRRMVSQPSSPDSLPSELLNRVTRLIPLNFLSSLDDGLDGDM